MSYLPNCYDVVLRGHDGGHVSLAGHVQALAECLVGRRLVALEDGGDGLHLVRLDLGGLEDGKKIRRQTYREAAAGRPGAVAGGADDGALVNVAGANEAVCQKP